MGASTIIVIAFAAGVVLVIGGGIMVYMGNLVRSAYEIKVQMKAEIEERLTKMSDDLDKKSRWIKRDLLEEIEKIKVALHTDSARKIGEMSQPIIKQLEALEGMIRAERAELTAAIDTDRQVIAGLDQRIKALQRVKDKDKALGSAPEPSGALDETAAILAAQASVNAEPAEPAKPATMMSGLQELDG